MAGDASRGLRGTLASSRFIWSSLGRRRSRSLPNMRTADSEFLTWCSVSDSICRRLDACTASSHNRRWSSTIATASEVAMLPTCCRSAVVHSSAPDAPSRHTATIPITTPPYSSGTESPEGRGVSN